MKEIYERVFVGCDYECFENKKGWVTVHACKSPCHQRAVDYRGSLPQNHPNYLVLKRENNLYLNIIDSPAPLFMMPLFIEFLRFIKCHWSEGKNVLIHCNQGESRAPSLALLFLAKDIGLISNESYEKAKKEFMKIYLSYSPGTGIQIYLRNHWREFDSRYIG